MSINAEHYLRTISDGFIQNGLWFSIHYKLDFVNGEVAFPGKAFQDITRGVSFAKYMMRKGHDVYVGQGGQREVKPPKKDGGIPIALRRRNNTYQCSSLYLDIDIRDDKGYSSELDALSALKNFMVKYKLPPMTMLINSGGGLHGYWTFEDIIPVEEFEQLAHGLTHIGNEFGLKFDQQCTSNPCCLLRLPDTFNFKHDPPRLVELKYSGSKIALDRMKEKLNVNGFHYPKVRSSIVHQKTFQAADIDVVATYCPMLHDTLEQGGANLQGEPHWHMVSALAAHCKDGERTTHRLCERHRHYDHNDTTQKFYDAVKARDQNPKLGPPKCDYVNKLGFIQCKSCSYLKWNTTPLMIPEYQGRTLLAPGTGHNSDLPEKYFRNDNHHIFYESTNTETNITEEVEVFPYPMIYDTIHIEGAIDGVYLVFDSIEGYNTKITVRIPCSSDKSILSSSLSKHGLVMIMSDATRYFMVTLMNTLRSKDETLVRHEPLGWVMHEGLYGFSYDGICYLPQTTLKARQLDGDFGRHYKVAGLRDPWDTLSGKIIAQDRPDINTIIACSFAAPLITLIGHVGFAVGIWSAGSGIGKSTALAINQAVWGSTIRMGGLDDTANQVVDTMATLRNLPFNWDELKGDKQIKQMTNVFFKMSQGREKGRLDQTARQKQQRNFETMLVWTTNSPLTDAIDQIIPDTAAGRYRMMEFEAHDRFVSTLDITEITSLTSQLRTNHGHIGALYSKYLGENHNKLQTDIQKLRHSIEQHLNANQSQRYWITGIACICAGAHIANQLGFTNFNLNTIRDFLFNRVKEMQHVSMSGQDGDISKPRSTEIKLGDFINAILPNTVKTDKMWLQRGKPGRGHIRVLNDNPNFINKNIVAQIDNETITLRVLDTAIAKWCREMGIAKSVFTSALQNNFRATSTRGCVASGTSYVSATSTVWMIPLKNLEIGRNMEF